MEDLCQSISPAWFPQEVEQTFTCLAPVPPSSWCLGDTLFPPQQLVAKTNTCSCSSHHRPRVYAAQFDSVCCPSVFSSHAGLASSWHLVLAAHTLAQHRISEEARTDHHVEAQDSVRQPW